ncbi:hypothetical protein FBU30_010464 [Linnemannia zychae]|nr:hypothetical protein FBU30_010464 [Linnemannia zychae]
MASTLDVIIANSDSQVVNVPYKDSEAVFFILERIRSQLGIQPEKVKRHDLYINGKRIQNHQESIDYYRIFGHTLTYRALSDEDITIYFKLITGQEHTMICKSSLSVIELKELFYAKTGTSPGRFIFQTVEMQHESLINDLGVRNGSTIHVVLRLRGGGITPGLVFSDVSDTSNVRKVHFSQNAPPGRYAAPGTNVECECVCTPTHRVICPRNFGTLELTDETFVCPNCRKSDKIIPVTVGFMECRYRFHGIKATGEQYTSNWVEVKSRDSYQLFSPDKSTIWRRLVIESADPRDCNDECTICLEKLRHFETLECGHKYHGSCISKWTGSCPSCQFNQHLATGRVTKSL